MTREELEAEARDAIMFGRSMNIMQLADWAERIQREAVDEERKALREIVGQNADRTAEGILAAEHEALRKLREASEAVVDGAAKTFGDPRVSYEEWQLEPGSIDALRAALRDEPEESADWTRKKRSLDDLRDEPEEKP